MVRALFVRSGPFSDWLGTGSMRAAHSSKFCTFTVVHALFVRTGPFSDWLAMGTMRVARTVGSQ